jgi:hypothetical protein
MTRPKRDSPDDADAAATRLFELPDASFATRRHRVRFDAPDASDIVLIFDRAETRLPSADSTRSDLDRAETTSRDLHRAEHHRDLTLRRRLQR